MGKSVIETELQQILQALNQFPDGATSEQIVESSQLVMGSRMLQRRLGKLIERGEVKLVGVTRGVRYHLIEKSSSKINPEIPKDNSGQIILSPGSQELLQLFSTPFDKRQAVLYNRKFVDSYRPNIDSYLSDIEKEQLIRDTATTADRAEPAGTYARQILQRLLIDLSWNSSRLEGNTYSLLDTLKLLNDSAAAPGKSAIETQMILNHKEAIEFMVRGGEEIGFNRYTLTNIHGLLANNLLADPAAPGRLRKHAVGIGNSAYTPTALPQLIEEMFDLILAKASVIRSPHEQALFLMVQLPYLQPFDDVNKRVSRLAANISLNRHNLVPISFIGVPADLYLKGLLAIYEMNRTDLLKDIFLQVCRNSANRYAAVRQTIGEPDPFRIKYREILQQSVTQIISGVYDKAGASIHIKDRALRIPQLDQDRFIEMVETELLSLHEGNFARYRVTPSQYNQWKEAWMK